MSTSDQTKAIHFLVVDDDADSRISIVEYLRSLGFMRVTLAHNGVDALRLMDRDPSINFIITDWDMPMMNGFELLKRIKTNDEQAHIPVLVVTSPISNETEKVVLAAEHMVDGYLIKPFRIQMLEEKIQKILTISAIGPKKKIIVVDDDVDARESVVEYLTQIGFPQVHSFENGHAALTFINQDASQIGLIISDWEMPDLTGIEFLRICKLTPDLKEIPFLMVTSQSSIERMKILQAAKANVDQYMLKPFNLETFKTRIMHVLEQARIGAELTKITHEGWNFLENGHYQNAALKFGEALQLSPEHENALRGMAEALTETVGVQAAMPYLKKAIDANPIYAKNYLKLAQVYEQTDQIDKAIALLESGNLNIGFNSELHFALGKLYFKSSFLKEAQKEFEKTIEIQADHAEARLFLQRINLSGKD